MHFFVTFFSLSDDFDMDSDDFDFGTLRNKANVKESLHKNLEHWPPIGANPCYKYYRKRLKKFIFYFLLPLQ